MFIDSHAHIQLDRFDSDRSVVIERAKNSQVSIILVVGFDISTSHLAVELADRYDHIYATVGLHPHDAKRFTPQTLREIALLAEHPKVVALGEMGLDYHRNLSPKSVQKRVFEEQLDLATQLDLPIVVHNRNAFDDILSILENRPQLTGGVLHCFSENTKSMDRVIDVGFHIGIGGPVTYKKSQDLKQVVKVMPADSFLIETDCPWLAPQLRRGKRNEPAYITEIATKIAELRQVTIESVGQTSSQNFRKLFSIK
ncbi:hydrolase TatD [Candidatus Poribacteria bacterium]|jgi:TatD DNase family protein|nr:hydrolase TatD [Candidatus Poribacteria bacterium]MEE2910073.1 TatD family hydrolase [Candidatus Poribacteria bacterium]|tara:strand:- start:23 stop:787 length:765 start_codon:yes stop_codon:yes gene_type:complete